MACAHNQAKIDAINAEIATKRQQISELNSNITKCGEIKKKHEQFNDKMNCVINNLADNYVVQGQAYDNGKMTECLNSSKDTINDCNDIINQSNAKISLLETEILALERQIPPLEGNCASCQLLTYK